MEVLVKIGQFLLSLSILVVLHELGHFTFAKLFKARVEKFYMFFNPGFSLFKFKKGETEYGMGWLPLGGYVKISGMIDESMDKEQLKQEPQPWEFRSKPAWQRLLIMIGGVLVNFVLAFAIYAAVLYTWGEQYLPANNVKYGVVCDSLSKSIGMQDGDKIYALDHENVDDFMDIVPGILLNDVKTIQVERAGEQKSITIPDGFVAALMEKSSKGFSMQPMFSPRVPFGPFEVDRFSKKSIAKAAGVEKGDKLIAVNNEKFDFYDQFANRMQSLKNQKVVVTVERNGQQMDLAMTLGDDAMLGIARKPVQVFDFKTHKYGFWESIPAGMYKGFDKLASYLKQFKLIFSSETKGYKSLGGFISIGNIFPGVWDWYAFWNLTAFLSIILAIMNILPIPALDGGHVMFLLYEIITGRKPGDKFLEYAQIAGMVLLFSLLIFANANDVMKLFNK
ncbi:MAG: RIP metalloprotease RseP [Marinifilaceae bacterium]